MQQLQALRHLRAWRIAASATQGALISQDSWRCTGGALGAAGFSNDSNVNDVNVADVLKADRKDPRLAEQNGSATVFGSKAI